MSLSRQFGDKIIFFENADSVAAKLAREGWRSLRDNFPHFDPVLYGREISVGVSFEIASPFLPAMTKHGLPLLLHQINNFFPVTIV